MKKIFFTLIVMASAAIDFAFAAPPPPPEGISFSVIVIDGQTKTPLELVRIALRRGNRLVAGKVTDINGNARFEDVVTGAYRIIVHRAGYHDFSDSIAIDAKHLADTVAMNEVGMQNVSVEETHEAAISTVDVNTGNQIFESETFHAPPSARMTDLIQENLAGAARAPTGEVHIRGQHGEFTFYVDGIPVPLGVFGGLNEIVDPKVIDRATFMTGGFPAEYGGQMAAVIDVQNRVPSGTFHLDASTYAGSYLAGGADSLGPRVGNFKAINSNGQSLSLSDHTGNLGFFLSGSRQETDRRIDPPVQEIFHDHGFDYFLYGKIDYLLGDKDYLTMNLNYGRTVTQIPFDSLEGGAADDNQRTTNEFQTLSYYHTFSNQADNASKLFIGAYAREGNLQTIPGAIDTENFQFPNDTALYNIQENRSFTTLGVRTKFDKQLSHEFSYAAGFNFSSTTGTENFLGMNQNSGALGPNPITNFAGSDFGMFAQEEWHPAEWTRIDAGVRYDQHIAPDLPFTNQVSPRIRWNFFIDEFSSAYLYAGSIFMPTNIEGLRTLASAAAGDAGYVGTLPERDRLFEASYVRRFDFGLTSKFAAFYKLATPGVDDQTLGSSAVKTPVNIASVYTTGVECGLSYAAPSTPFSATLNAALTHAYGEGTISGGFLAFNSDGGATDLDHDQRLSVVARVNYQPENWFANATAIYGSGLTNGNPITFGTGLLDFNQAAHTTPSWIVNLSGGYTFLWSGGSSLEPSLYITNIFNNEHLIKGAYFSAASWEEPRGVVFKIAYHI